mmetsp:Transcript_8040/g.30165  ORF Transcript_8040/g.30165 Transcript_8040/m.30165 type:complete len:225 (+) Transcript_8040:2316-2990(+)
MRPWQRERPCCPRSSPSPWQPPGPRGGPVPRWCPWPRRQLAGRRASSSRSESVQLAVEARAAFSEHLCCGDVGRPSPFSSGYSSVYCAGWRSWSTPRAAAAAGRASARLPRAQTAEFPRGLKCAVAGPPSFSFSAWLSPVSARWRSALRALRPNGSRACRPRSPAVAEPNRRSCMSEPLRKRRTLLPRAAPCAAWPLPAPCEVQSAPRAGLGRSEARLPPRSRR